MRKLSLNLKIVQGIIILQRFEKYVRFFLFLQRLRDSFNLEESSLHHSQGGSPYTSAHVKKPAKFKTFYSNQNPFKADIYILKKNGSKLGPVVRSFYESKDNYKTMVLGKKNIKIA